MQPACVAGQRIGHVRGLEAGDGGLDLSRGGDRGPGRRLIGSAPAPQRAAAPAMPRDPAMTRTCPNRPLWLSRGLGPRTGTASIASSVMFILDSLLEAAGSRGRVPGRDRSWDLCRWTSFRSRRRRLGRLAGLAHAARDQAGDVAAAEAGVDIHDHDVRGAAIEHPQQRRHAVKVGAVADAGWNGDDRAIDQAADHAGERPFHSRDDDQGVGADASRSSWCSSRCSPATPTSATSDTSQFQASAVTFASSATGKSLVPAVTIITLPSLGSVVALAANPEGPRPRALCSPCRKGLHEVQCCLGIEPRHQPSLVVSRAGCAGCLRSAGPSSPGRRRPRENHSALRGAGRPWQIRRPPETGWMRIWWAACSGDSRPSRTDSSNSFRS